MARGSGKRIRRRNVLIVFLLFGATGALVVLAHLRPPAALVTAEPAELTAKRTDKENNACFTLQEALGLLPEAPPALLLKDETGWEYKYKAEENSLGELLNIARPDDDALLIDYIKNSRPAMEFALKALDKPWFLVPEVPRMSGQGYIDSIRSRRNLQRLPSLFMATAIIQPCSEDPAQDACAFLHNAARLIALINRDGSPFPFMAAPQAIQVIRKASPDHQRHMTEWIEQIRRDWTPPDTYVDGCIRGVYSASVSDFTVDREPQWAEKVLISFMIAREKRMMRRYEDQVRMAGRMTYFQFDAYARDHPTTRGYEGRFIAPDLSNLLWPNSAFLANMDSLSIAIALEAYKRDKGQYPDTLSALTPDYLPQLPKNPFDGQDYTYRREGDDYALYCRGGHRRRDDWMPNQYLVFHAPPGPEGRAWKPPATGKGR